MNRLREAWGLERSLEAATSCHVVYHGVRANAFSTVLYLTHLANLLGRLSVLIRFPGNLAWSWMDLVIGGKKRLPPVFRLLFPSGQLFRVTIVIVSRESCFG